MKKLNYEEFNISISSLSPILIEFESSLCSVCEKANLFLKKLENAYNNKIIISKINIDEQISLISTYSLIKIPTFIFFKNSLELTRIVGFKDGIEIERFLRTLLKN
jgi:thioredoxin 1